MKKLFYWLLFFIAFCQKSLFAQVYNFKTYNLEQGLPQSEIWDMVSDSRGYLWLGTNGGGLAKFNGKTFQAFTKKDGLPNEQVSTLFEDRQGNIWAMTFSGLARYDGFSFTTFGKEEGIEEANAPFANFAVDENNNLWVLQFTQGQPQLKILENNKFVDIATKFEELKNPDLRFLRLFHSKNKIFIATNNNTTQERKLLVYEKGKFSTYQNPNINLASNEFLVPFFEDSNLNLWFATVPAGNNQLGFVNKIMKVTPKNDVQNMPVPPNLPLFFAARVGEDKNKNIWIPLNNFQGNNVADVIWRYSQNGEVKAFTQSNGLSTTLVANIAHDREGNIWLGTRGFGVIRYVDEKFTAVNQTNGLLDEVVRTFYDDKKGNTWIGSVGNSLYQWNGTSLKTYPSSFPIGRIMKIEPEENGSFLLATNVGLVRFREGVFTPVNAEFGIPQNVGAFAYILKSKDDNLWFSAQGTGIWRYDKKTKTTTQYNVANKKLQSNGVYGIFEDSKGNIWLNSNGGVHRIEKKGLLQNEDERITVFTKANGMVETLTQQTTEDKNGNIWVTSFGGGIARFDGTKFISYTKENSGLGANLIYSITTDKSGNLWVGSQGYVSKIEIDDKSEVTKITNYGENEGFTGKETNGVAIYNDSENNMWFGTLKGAYKYDAKADLPNEIKPIANITGIRLFFKSIKWGEKPYTDYRQSLTAWFADLPQKLSLPYEQNHIAFDFEAINFENPSLVEFQWKLEGVDKDWTPPIQKYEAVYPYLAPKTYTFKVRAGVKGNWGETVSYQFKITPPWWQEWWFLVSVAILIASIIYFVVRMRIKALKDEQVKLEMLVNEKTAEVRQQRDEIMAQATHLQQANNEITRQSDLLAQKNRDITASINYAKRIQTAMLPQEADIQKVIPELFVLFQPKDIVSGDFYYFENIENELLILAAVDCTGHGVPGAFMSMIGNDLLNHIILEKEIYAPHLILEEMNKGVRKSLKQAETTVRDGMDLNLVMLDKANQLLHFAGAMNPLYYVQGGVFREIKGDKRPIGGGYQENEFAYTTHTIDISEGITFYLCSDGYQDQFNEQGRKFMVRRFRELLASISHLPMPEQKQVLTSTLNNWLHNARQIDDILVLGIRV